MDTVEDFVKRNYNNNGKPWTSSRRKSSKISHFFRFFNLFLHFVNFLHFSFSIFFMFSFFSFFHFSFFLLLFIFFFFFFIFSVVRADAKTQEKSSNISFVKIRCLGSRWAEFHPCEGDPAFMFFSILSFLFVHFLLLLRKNVSSFSFFLHFFPKSFIASISIKV